MTNKEVIKQLESLAANQKDFIIHDETGIFERDVKALDKAVNIIKSIEELKKFIQQRIKDNNKMIDSYIDSDESIALNYMYQNHEAKVIYRYIEILEGGQHEKNNK